MPTAFTPGRTVSAAVHARVNQRSRVDHAGPIAHRRAHVTERTAAVGVGRELAVVAGTDRSDRRHRAAGRHQPPPTRCSGSLILRSLRSRSVRRFPGRRRPQCRDTARSTPAWSDPAAAGQHASSSCDAIQPGKSHMCPSASQCGVARARLSTPLQQPGTAAPAEKQSRGARSATRRTSRIARTQASHRLLHTSRNAAMATNVGGVAAMRRPSG
jgi:hypothetical protein